MISLQINKKVYLRETLLLARLARVDEKSSPLALGAMSSLVNSLQLLADRNFSNRMSRVTSSIH